MRDNCTATNAKKNCVPNPKDTRRKLKEYLKLSLWDEMMHFKREKWLGERPECKTHNQ
jgi:hypothetical protein